VKNCWSARKRTLAVDGDRVARRVCDEVGDLLASHRPGARDADLRKVRDELVGRLSVRLDRLGREVAGSQIPTPGVHQASISVVTSGEVIRWWCTVLTNWRL
jgi:hypothetical protein